LKHEDYKKDYKKIYTHQRLIIKERGERKRTTVSVI